MSEFKIIERCGKFIVFYFYKEFSIWKWKYVTKWRSARIGGLPWKLASFQTIKEAREYVKIISKPDVEHSVD